MRIALLCLGALVGAMPVLAQEEGDEREAKAWVICISDPPGAQILVGHPMSQESWEKGVTPSRVPVFDVGHTPRQMRFTFAKPGYEPYTSLVTVSSGDEVRLVAKLSPRRYLSYVSDGKLVVANADGSTPTDVAELEPPVSWEAPVWFDGASSVAVWQAGELWLYSPEGDAIGAVITPAEAARAAGVQQAVSLWGAVALASGRGLLCLGAWQGGTGIFFCPVDPEQEATLLVPGATGLSACPKEDVFAAIGPEGARVYGLRESGEVDVLSDLPEVTEVVWSPDGAQVAAALKGELYVGDAGLTQLVQVTASEQAGPRGFVWHPSGKAVLCTIPRRLTARSRWDEIWLVRTPGVEGDPLLVVDGRGHAHSSTMAPLAFVPYSDKLAYRVGDVPSHRTYLVDFAEPGSGEPLLYNSGLPSWSNAVARARAVNRVEDEPEVEEEGQ